MSVVVSTNLADGVILGVDSAITVPGPPPLYGEPLPPGVMHGGILKVYEDADKLFPFGERPIGIATFAGALIGQRTVASHVREFIRTRTEDGPDTLAEVTEEIRSFFMNLYTTATIPIIEQSLGKPWDQIPADQRPAYGFVIGGFARNAELSEVWMVVLPLHATPNSAQLMRRQGDFSTNWFALYEPINRYMLGYSTPLLQELQDYFVKLRGSPFSSSEQEEIRTILSKHEFIVPVGAMPIPVGVAFTRFLVELVINHHRYAIGAPVVGGRSRIATVTYKGFHTLE